MNAAFTKGLHGLSPVRKVQAEDLWILQRPVPPIGAKDGVYRVPVYLPTQPRKK